MTREGGCSSPGGRAWCPFHPGKERWRGDSGVFSRGYDVRFKVWSRLEAMEKMLMDTQPVSQPIRTPSEECV